MQSSQTVNETTTQLNYTKNCHGEVNIDFVKIENGRVFNVPF